MKKVVINKITLLLISFFILPLASFASGSVGTSISGDGTYKPGDTVTLHINVGTVQNTAGDGKVYAFQGTINYDSGCLQLQSINSTNGWSKTGNGATFIVGDYGLSNGIQNSSVATVKFVALNDCQTTVSLKNTAASDTKGDISVGGSSKSIRIYTPSSNNNLASLSVNPGGINFNGGTSYSTQVGASVTSVTVSASAQDPKAKISGATTHNLNYGANDIKVTVTAEDGSKKTYSINVNRKDDRSTNNNLASLHVSNGKLSPGFSKGNTKYTMEVPFATEKLNITAKAEDAKAKVNISNPDLVAEEVTQVKISVTAENGQTKTYTIDVKRGKDPNKPLSNNNYLDTLQVSTGMLSPEFNKEKTNYAVYLPFEVAHIDVTVHQEDTKYATIKKEESNDLSIGNNLFKYTVTAEDGSTRVYTLTVVRNKALEEVKTNSNVYLKKLELNNGRLIDKFDKKVNVIYYKKNKGDVTIKVAEPEVKENIVQTYKLKKAFVIMVESPSGERNYYVLIEKSYTLYYVVAILSLIIIGLLLVMYKIKKKSNNNDNNTEKKVKKRKKDKKQKELN